MNIIKVIDKKQIEQLFNNWEETMIYSCLEGYMGEAYATENLQSAMIVIADFCFLAGIPSKELLENSVFKRTAIIVLRTDDWDFTIEKVYPNAMKRRRYATRKDTHYFDVDALKNNIVNLPIQYKLKRIDEGLYHQVLKQTWSCDLCRHYQTYQEYQKTGFGFVIMEGHQIVAGVSSYCVYKGGIEIEIDTREDRRRQGLAKVCASKMILECLYRNLYPSWDADNQKSLNLAESLGYVFDKSYFIYEVSSK